MLTAQRVMMKATELALTGEKVTMQNIVVNDTNRDEFRDRLVRYFTDIIPLPPEVGIEERIPEVGMVCVENGRIIGVATIAKVLIRQLGMDMWFYRTSVSPDHRHVDIARSLANDLYAHMDAQYEPGKGMPVGFFYLIEAEVLIRNLPHCVWPTTGAVFIGLDNMGRQRSIKYFTRAMLDDPWETSQRVVRQAVEQPRVM